jgi:ubiquinone/menaquinone biosynthesis C-methylase UbiE
MPHRFNPKRLASLDNPLRRLLAPPKRTLARLGVKAGDVVIDLGAGSGFFALPASEMVGGEGKVFAVDIEPEAIAIIERKRLERGRKNLRAILSSEEGLGLEDGVGSLALMYTVFHEVGDKARMLGDLRRALRPGGRIAIVEFRGGASFGPPRSERIGEEEMLSLLTEAGFTNAEIRPWSPSLYAAKALK